MTCIDFDRACEILLSANLRAGACIMRHYHSELEVDRKNDDSPVTLADREAEAVLLQALERLAPDIPVISEESAEALGQDRGRLFFLVDPLDGTKEFIKKRSDFTVNVALVEDGRPVFGMVFAPARGMLAFTRAPGHAVMAEVEAEAADTSLADLTLRPLAVRDVPPEGITAVVSASHLDEGTESFLKDFPVAARDSAGSSLKFLRLAQGAADLYPRLAPTMEWDTAAGHAVLEAAGGSVLTPAGEPLQYGKWEEGLKNASFVAWGKLRPE